jgi:hypothetical protein
LIGLDSLHSPNETLASSPHNPPEVGRPTLGRWGGLAAIGVGLAAFQLLACLLLLKWGWRAGIVRGVSIALAILVDQELTRAIEPALGHSGSVIVALSTAGVAGIIAWQVTSRLLRVNA